MQNSGHQPAFRKQFVGSTRLSRGPVPGSKAPSTSQERQALRHCWQDNRHLGDGAVIASMAEIVSRTRLSARNACEVIRPDLDARMLMQDGLRRGWLSQAA